MKIKCKKCGKGYKKITKEGYCAICYKDVYKKWSPEFSSVTPGSMKFGRNKAGGKK